MAPSCSGAALGLADRNDYREVNPLKLGAEHVPFPCSLRELVLDRYGEPPGVGSNTHPMQLDELLEYLKKIDNFSLSPWVAIVGQTEAIGDPATPSREQIAILRWLGKALELWEKQFPLEGRVAAQVRRLKPLSAALAIVDPKFMQPGSHPVHQLLDSIQARAIGWQARLDRVGAILEQQVAKTVDESRRWFDNKSTDLAALCAEFSAAAERDQARAQRMVQRVVEAEAGKVKTATAKQEAARMINAALEKNSAPEEIGEFIKGPWYTSAQLLLLKFGAKSDQWQMMSRTTETLLDSLQSMEEADEARRQHIFEVVTQLPKEMRRWLLSLHHDTEAVNEAMGLVEFAHLKILRRQSLQLQRIQPIVVEGEQAITGSAHVSATLKNWREGQWCSVDTGDGGIVRMQLVLKVEESQQLLFTNLAGIKVLQLSFTEFTFLIDDNKVKALYSGASFSLCLAYAVGIDTVEILEALASALATPEPDSESESESETTAEPVQVSRSEQSIPTPRKPEPEPELQVAPQSSPEPEPVAEKPVQADAHQAAHAQREPEVEAPAPTDRSAPLEKPPVSKKPASPAGFLIEQAEDIKARGGFILPQKEHRDSDAGKLTPKPGAGDTGLGHLAEQARNINTGRERSLEKAGESEKRLTPLTWQTQDNHEDPGPPSAPGPASERHINLPMGAWLGFHDGETPLMARLAVHDLEGDFYIFVNRQGVKMRQVSKLELLKLIDSGMVDILETISNFRDSVTEVRKNLDQK
jgi:hypothetical protein